MTQDIVGRLRNNRWPIDIEAADEITKLRAEVERLTLTNRDNEMYYERYKQLAGEEADRAEAAEAERDEATAQLASNSNALNIAAQIKHEASMTTSGFGLARLLRELDEALQLCTLPDRARDMLEERDKMRAAVNDLSYCLFCDADMSEGHIAHIAGCWYAALNVIEGEER